MHSVKENTLANIDNISNSVSISYQSSRADVERYCNLQWLSLGDCLPRKRGSDSFHLRTSFEPAPSLHDQHHPGLTSLSSAFRAFHSELLLQRINSHFSLIHSVMKKMVLILIFLFLFLLVGMKVGWIYGNYEFITHPLTDPQR